MYLRVLHSVPATCKARLQQAQPPRKVRVALRQRNHEVHVIGQHNRRDGLEWPLPSHIPPAFPQQINAPHQQVRPPIHQVHRKEERAPGQEEAAIVGHVFMFGYTIQRGNPERWASLRSTRFAHGISILHLLFLFGVSTVAMLFQNVSERKSVKSK